MEEAPGEMEPPRGEEPASRIASRRDGPPGPRPALARALAWVYGLTGAMALATIAADHPRWRAEARWVLAGIAAYALGLAWGAARLRSKSPRHPGSFWICLPLVPHALAGLLGAAVLLAASFGARRAPIADHLLLASLYAIGFGWVPAMAPLLLARRAEILFFFAIAAPMALGTLSR